MIKSLHNIRKLFFIFIFYCLPYISHAQTSSFTITYSGFTPEGETAFNYAAQLWSTILISDIPIKIHAHYQILIPGTLAITFPNGELNFAAAPISNVWYASSLANAISGVELNGDDADMDIYVNNLITWYTGTDGLCPAGKYDMVTTILHEICHGLGFLSLANKQGATGSFGLIDSLAFSPLTTSFAWPQLDTLPSVFDYYLQQNDGTVLTSITNPSETLGVAIASNDVYLNSPQAVAANGGVMPKIYAPVSFVLGSSMSHLNEATYPVGNENELMTPNGAAGFSLFNPGPIVLNVLRDIGWQIHDITPIDDVQTTHISTYPNPTKDLLHIHTPFNCIDAIINILDVDGKIISSKKMNGNDMEILTSELIPGIYFLKIYNAQVCYICTIIKSE